MSECPAAVTQCSGMTGVSLRSGSGFENHGKVAGMLLASWAAKLSGQKAAPREAARSWGQKHGLGSVLAD
jgi:hypothetical protein